MSSDAKPTPRQRARRYAKRALWALAAVVTLVVLLQQIANFRGARAWNAALEKLAAAGETTDLAGLLPPPIPAAENFFATPALAQIALPGESGDGARARIEELGFKNWAKMEASGPSDDTGSRVAQPTAFAFYIEALAGAGVLMEPSDAGDAGVFLETFDHAFSDLVTEFEAAVERPRSQVIDETLRQATGGGAPLISVAMPHLSPAMALGKAMALRGAAAAQAGDRARMNTSLATVAKVSEGMAGEPLLIGFLISMALEQMYVEIVWEAMAAGTLTREDLASIEQRLKALDISGRYVNAVRGELTAAVDITEHLKRNSDQGILSDVAAMDAQPDGFRAGSPAMSLLMPEGWLDQNGAKMIEMYLDYFITPGKKLGIRGIADREFELQEEMERLNESLLSWPHTFLVRLMFPALTGVTRRAIELEEEIQRARIACTLEREFLVTGTFPHGLTDKVAADLREPPVSYERDGTGFVLTSASGTEWKSGPRE